MGHKQSKKGKAPRSGQNPNKHSVVYVEDAEHKTIHWFVIFNWICHLLYAGIINFFV